VPDLAVPGQPRGSKPAAEGWDWDGDDWDPAQSLTAEEIAALAALDREGDPVDDWDEDPSDAAPVDADAWLADPRPWLQGDEPYPPSRDGPVEALPGLMPRRLGSGGGFDAGGMADRVPPGPVLAGLTADKWAAGLSRASDDELAGLMIAWRRIVSWAAAGELAAVAELSRRRRAQVASGADPHLAEHVSDEVAMVLTLTSWAAGTLVDRAAGLARLPRTMAALAAGEIDVPKALVILGELSGLGDVHAARVEAAVIGRAAGWTMGELRRAARHQVFAAGTAAARRRKERAAKQARVERWAEDAGTAALAGRDLPPAGAGRRRAPDRLGQAAQDSGLRREPRPAARAGIPGAAERPAPRIPPPHRRSRSGRLHRHSRCQRDPTDACRKDNPTNARDKGQQPGPASGGPSASPPGCTPDPSGPSMRGSVNLVLPLSTWLGRSASPGGVAGFGPLDAADSRAVAAALARDPATKWCVTVTGPDGRAAAHGCAKAGPGSPPTESDGPGRNPGPPPSEPDGPGRNPRPPPSEPDSPGGDAKQVASEPGGLHGGPGPPPPPGVRTWLTSITLAWLETGECSHRRESPGYRPSPSLTHLIQARQVTCTAPGCRRPATSCDFEHTIPYHLGGRSCECNGGPCCRRHHRAKQAEGWHLSQPRPGSFVWTTPHGRSYRTEPEPYLT
jgi:hypothetical protein